MSERMNKERAIERLKQVKDNTIKLSTYAEIQEPEDNTIQILQEQIQALDIAIESLDNEWVDVRDRLPSEDKDYFVTIKSRIDYADRYYIVLAHWEKSTTDKSVEGWWTSIGWNRAEKQHLYDITNDVVAWKKVEPYERKEYQNDR